MARFGISKRKEHVLLVGLFFACALFDLVFLYVGLRFTIFDIASGFEVSLKTPLAALEHSSIASCSLQFERLVQLFALPFLHNLLVALCCDRLFAVFFPIRYHRSTKKYQFVALGGEIGEQQKPL